MQLAVKYLAKPRVKERENSGNSPPKTQNSGFGPGTFRNSENDPTHIVIFRRISPACSDLPKSTINITLYSSFELQLSTMDPSESSVVLGVTFDSLRELKDVCKAYSIENAFEYKVVKPIKLVLQSLVRQKHVLGVFMPHRSKDPLSFASRRMNPSTLVSASITKVTHKLAKPFSLKTSRINSRNNLLIVQSILLEMFNVNSVSKSRIPKLSAPKNTRRS